MQNVLGSVFGGSGYVYHEVGLLYCGVQLFCTLYTHLSLFLRVCLFVSVSLSLSLFLSLCVLYVHMYILSCMHWPEEGVRYLAL